VGGGAITIGNTTIYGGVDIRGQQNGPTSPTQQGGGWTLVGQHEMQHTFQGQMTSILYLPLNLIGGICGYIQNPHVYDPWHNPANFMESGPQQIPPVPFPGLPPMGPPVNLKILQDSTRGINGIQ
jgi:hypothetical protein